MADVEARDYFSHTTKPSFPSHDFKQARSQRTPVAFTSPTISQRPHPTSRMSTHRTDKSTTNFAEVLDDNGGPDGLRKLDVDYFDTILDIFQDRKQHHSPVVFDFMLLHEINIHHLEHLLVAEWDWLTVALSQDEQVPRSPHFAEQAPRRLEEIRSLLHKYSTALRDFEDMRKRATLDEASNPFSHSSWHEKLLHLEARLHGHPEEHVNPLRKLSNALLSPGSSRHDPEKQRADIRMQNRDASQDNEGGNGTKKKKLFGVASPACRQLAGVEDWVRERSLREFTKEQKKRVEREEWLAARFKRFALAFFAGIALIGPMLLMTLVRDLTCSLATTSVATLLFALLVTYFTQVSDRDIVVITAGYAAVLVVFVGTQH